MLRLALSCIAFVALSASAQADSRKLPVPSITLYPGEAVDQQSLQFKTFNGSDAIWRNYVLNAGDLAGKFARRTLVAGRPIALSAIKNPDAVKRGVLTRAILTSGGLEITASLIPLQSGAAGDTVEARNMTTGMTIHATVMPDGSLAVPAP